MDRSPAAVVRGAVVPSLTRWGRSPDADLLYRRLVTLGPASVGELLRELGMSRQRVTDGLDELAAIGAATRQPTDPTGRTAWAPRPVTEVVGALRRDHRRLLSRNSDPRRQHVQQHALVNGLLAYPAAGGNGIRHLPTRQLTRARLAELVVVARHEHMAMNPEQVFDAESARPALAMDRTLHLRNVRTRVLGVQPADPDPMLQHGRLPTDARPNYRIGATMPMKLFVVDRTIALFPLVPSDLSCGYLEVTQPSMVSTLVTLFEQHWDTSHDPQDHAAPAVVLAPRERALLNLLAQGYTDLTAAAELRISPRSVSNILRRLMDRLGVENRFQLGLALGAMDVVHLPTGSTAADPPPADR